MQVGGAFADARYAAVTLVGRTVGVFLSVWV